MHACTEGVPVVAMHDLTVHMAGGALCSTVAASSLVVWSAVLCLPGTWPLGHMASWGATPYGGKARLHLCLEEQHILAQVHSCLPTMGTGSS